MDLQFSNFTPHGNLFHILNKSIFNTFYKKVHYWAPYFSPKLYNNSYLNKKQEICHLRPHIQFFVVADSKLIGCDSPQSNTPAGGLVFRYIHFADKLAHQGDFSPKLVTDKIL